MDTPLSDKVLIQKIIIGNEKAFTLLINRYNQKLCVYAYKLISNDEAQDLVQNVFMKMWVKRTKLNPDQNIKNFLYKSVFNEFIDTYRKNKRLKPLDQEYVHLLTQYIETTSTEDLENAIKIMQQEIDKLPEKRKAIFILSKREGLTNNEIAEYLNISIKTVESNITKSYAILKAKLGSNTELILFLLFGRSESN